MCEGGRLKPYIDPRANPIPLNAFFDTATGRYTVSEGSLHASLFSSHIPVGWRAPEIGDLKAYCKKNYLMVSHRSLCHPLVKLIADCFLFVTRGKFGYSIAPYQLYNGTQYKALVDRNRTSFGQVCLFNLLSLCTLFLILGVQCRVAPEFAADVSD